MNSDLVNLLINLDKHAENVLKKNSNENSVAKSFAEPKHKLLGRKATTPVKTPAVVSQKDRRIRRTLRAKINGILNGLPENCSVLSKKDLKIEKILKKKKFDEVNLLRRNLGKVPINFDDFSLNNSFDRYGNILPAAKELTLPLTPRKALREKLTPTELEMLEEDPVYFIQNEKYKYTLKLGDDKDWKKLIKNDQEIEHFPEIKTRVLVRKDKTSFFQTIQRMQEKKKTELFEKISQKIQKALEKKEKYKKTISMKIREQFSCQSLKNLQKTDETTHRTYLKQSGSVSKFESPKKFSIEDYKEKFERAQRFLLNKKDIDEKIYDFELHARKADDLRSGRVKEIALSEKVQKAKRTQSKKNLLEKTVLPREKPIIKLLY